MAKLCINNIVRVIMGEINIGIQSDRNFAIGATSNISSVGRNKRPNVRGSKLEFNAFLFIPVK